MQKGPSQANMENSGMVLLLQITPPRLISKCYLPVLDREETTEIAFYNLVLLLLVVSYLLLICTSRKKRERVRI